MKNVYFLLHCDFTSANYELGYGPESAKDEFFDSFRDKYGYDKYGEGYDEDSNMNVSVYTFKDKSDLIKFVSHNVGIPYSSGQPVKTPEDYKKEKLKIAEEMISYMKLHKFSK